MASQGIDCNHASSDRSDVADLCVLLVELRQLWDVLCHRIGILILSLSCSKAKRVNALEMLATL